MGLWCTLVLCDEHGLAGRLSKSMMDFSVERTTYLVTSAVYIFSLFERSRSCGEASLCRNIFHGSLKLEVTMHTWSIPFLYTHRLPS